MKVCIVGAGAIGSHLGARLSEGGANVSMLARGHTLASLRSNGLEVRAPDKQMHFVPVASDQAQELGHQDVVFVCVKAPALPSIAASITPLLGPETVVVFTMNGVPWWYYANFGGPLAGTRLAKIDPEDRIWKAVGPDRTIGSIIYSPCTVLEPGVIKVGTAPSQLTIGELDGTISGRIREIAGVVNAGGLETEVTSVIRDFVWQKLLYNIASGPIAILTQSSMQQMCNDPAIADLIRLTVAEGIQIADALGHKVTLDAEALISGGKTSAHKSSMLQDLQAGRPLELDAQFIVPLEMAHRVGAATPVLDRLVTLSTLRARSAGLYSG